MTANYVLSLTDPEAELVTVGGKGASLARLCAAGLPVPGGFHITTRAYREFVVANRLDERIRAALEGVDVARSATLDEASRTIHELFLQSTIPPEVAADIANAYIALPGSDPAVAVRSSATAEDLPDLSFAGQQETYLNIHGIAEVQEAVKKCWASLWTPRAIAYRAQHHIDHNTVSMGVTVQLLVRAEAAGILFTADPVTGQRDRALISAAWGLGEAVVGGLVTPDSLYVSKDSGQVLVRQTADKQVMTVPIDDHSEERPVPEDLRRAPVLDDRAAAELARLGVQIETLYGIPMDIEWARADGQFAVLQARPITALPEANIVPLSDWQLPEAKWIYIRGSLAEHLPNPVSPLFATLGLRLAKQATDVLMHKFLGGDEIPLNFFVINGYLYQGMLLGPKETLRYTWMTLTQTIPILKGGIRVWQAARENFSRAVSQWGAEPIEALTSSQLLAGAQELFLEAARYYTAVQSSTLPTATSSETLFTKFYEGLVKGRDDPKAANFLVGFETIPIRAEKSLFDLASWCRQRPALQEYIQGNSSRQVAHALQNSESPAGLSTEDWSGLRQRLHAHFDTFGHTVYDFDFTNPMPAEDPELLMDTVKMYLEGKGNDPYARQHAAASRREQAEQAILSRLGWPKRGWFEKLLHWAQQYVLAREDSLADMGLAHPLIRRCFAELGRRLVQNGAIERADDIYWLEESEVEALVTALDSDITLPNFSARIPDRKAMRREAQKVIPPAVLPETSRLAKLIPWSEQRQGDQIVLKGFGASPGKITAPACVIFGPQDFHRMTPGNVLVAVTTTPAWTPLFAMASAVVTDIGGPLSHSSIVAREYSIPAVMAVGVATRRIQDGQLITVDGSAGIVTLSSSPDGASQQG